MTSIKLPYIHRFRDRHGRVRFYYRRAGFPRVRLLGRPGSPEFLAAYEAAASRSASAPLRHEPPGTMGALISSYMRTPSFERLKPSTSRVYSRILEGLRAEHGPRLVTDLDARAVRALIQRKAKTPAAANRLLSILRILARHGIERGDLASDPTQGVRRIREAAKGFHSWTEDEIEAFERRHPVGSKARLALALLLYTGQRRGDVVRLGPADVRDGHIMLVQGKTGARLSLPLLLELREALAATTTGLSAFLVTAYGRPFTAAGFGGWFRERCDEAGLPNCTAHGLRKAAARRLAEAGCSTHEIAAVTGHVTLAEVQRYAKGADQRRLADAAMGRLGGLRKP